MLKSILTKELGYLLRVISFFIIVPIMVEFLSQPIIANNEIKRKTMHGLLSHSASILSSHNCSWPELKLLDPPGPVTALVSKPGSGNTWVRHLLQLATGVQTGSIFNERKLKLGGFPGEGIIDGSVVAIKTHNLAKKYDRYIVLIRDPLQAALSEFNRRKTYNVKKNVSHTDTVAIEEFDDLDWHGFAKKFVHGFKEFTKAITALDPAKICILEYENLVEDVIKELKPCVEFLGFHIDVHLAHCIQLEKEGMYHRKASKSKEADDAIFSKPFSPEEVENFKSATLHFKQSVISHGKNKSHILPA